MANYTSNYNLHQWEPSDNFLRTDFNEDFAKIDTALAGKAEKTALSSLQTVVSGKTEIVVGSYTGNGETSQTIKLGFQPKLVLIPAHDCYAVTAVPGSTTTIITLTSNGFTVKDKYNLGVYANVAGTVYYYLALK